MKVKELINYLKNYDDDDIVQLCDIGQDSGDWYDLDLNYSKFRIKILDTPTKNSRGFKHKKRIKQ